jgi:DNA-binding NarL/FixJ family response regulator
MNDPLKFEERGNHIMENNLRVFISDDSPIVRVRLASMISDIQGIDVIGEAQNVEDSLEQIQLLNPDAVVLDIRMPGGSGIDVLRAIKKKDNPPLVIILTNYTFPQYKETCMESGADFFFDKSNEYHKVIDIFKNLVAFENSD